MNKYQILALWIGVLLALTTFLLPPRFYGGYFYGFAPLWSGGAGGDPALRIDYPLLLCEWGGVAILTGAAIVTLGKVASHA